MDNVKKMVLVDEREWNSMKDNKWEKPMTSLLKKIDSSHQLSWKRPIEQRAKSDLSKQLQRLLNDDTIDDSVKSKIFNQALSRFQHTGKQVPTIEQEEEPETDDESEAEPIKRTVKKPKRKTKVLPKSSIKTRSHKRKIPRFDWVEY